VKAVRFHEYGDFDVLRVEDVEDPVPGEGELLLRVRAAGVNPVDWKILHGWMAADVPLEAPRGLGFDVAGVVEQTGPGVDDFAPGDEVLGIPAGPAYAELALARPEALVRKPPGIEWPLAGGLGVVAGTAYATLDRLAPELGETLAIAGASGAVGSLAAQLAVARGVRVIGTTSAARAGQVEALGVTPVPYGGDLLERLKEAAPEGADAALDASGHGELAALVELAGGPARVLSIASYAEAQELGVEFHAGGGGGHQRAALEEVMPLIESGRISFPVAGIFALGEVGEALRESEHGHPMGKLVVVPA
jgi:NADPH:quinone reductase-like Zn-dependent oxidoreductase